MHVGEHAETPFLLDSFLCQYNALFMTSLEKIEVGRWSCKQEKRPWNDVQENSGKICEKRTIFFQTETLFTVKSREKKIIYLLIKNIYIGNS